MRHLVLAALLAGLPAPAASDPIRVVSVDVTPLLSPGPSNAGPQNTMGQALLALDTGGLFDVTELTPAEFRVLTVSQISSFDLLAVNNHPGRLDDGSGLGLGTTWQQAVGVQSGGRVLLSSHDAPRFHMNQTPPAFSLFPGPGEAPFGAGDLVRQAALWAGGVPGQTGLLIFNDAPPFVGGQGWDNAALDLPAAWGITDLDPYGGVMFPNGGYTDIVSGFESHPVYLGLSDGRFDVGSLSSFYGNHSDASFHSIFGAYDPGIFLPSEVVVRAGDFNPEGLGVFGPPLDAGLDGSAITLMRFELPEPAPAVLLFGAVLVLLASRGRGRAVAAVVLFALLPSSADAVSLYLTTVNGSDTQPGTAVLETAALGVQSYEFWMDIGGIATDPVALDGPLLAFQVVQRTAPGVTVDSFARSGTFPNTITQVSPDGSIFEVIGLAPFICLSGNCPAEGPGPKLLGTLVVDLGVAQDPVLLALVGGGRSFFIEVGGVNHQPEDGLVLLRRSVVPSPPTALQLVFGLALLALSRSR